MKGIKRFLSIFLVLAMIMTSNASFVFADSVNDNDATTALQTTTTENHLEYADENIEEEASANTDTKNTENDNKDIKTTNAENDENNIIDNQNDDIENIVATDNNEEDDDNLSPDDFSNEDNDNFEYEEEPEEDSTTVVTDTTRPTTDDENENTVDSEETSQEAKQTTTETAAETTAESEEQTAIETTTEKEEQTTAETTTETTTESEEQTTAETTTETTKESEEQTTTETTTKNEDVVIATDSEMEEIVSEELPNNIFDASAPYIRVVTLEEEKRLYQNDEESKLNDIKTFIDGHTYIYGWYKFDNYNDAYVDGVRDSDYDNDELKQKIDDWYHGDDTNSYGYGVIYNKCQLSIQNYGSSTEFPDANWEYVETQTTGQGYTFTFKPNDPNSFITGVTINAVDIRIKNTNTNEIKKACAFINNDNEIAFGTEITDTTNLLLNPSDYNKNIIFGGPLWLKWTDASDKGFYICYVTDQTGTSKDYDKLLSSSKKSDCDSIIQQTFNGNAKGYYLIQQSANIEVSSMMNSYNPNESGPDVELSIADLQATFDSWYYNPTQDVAYGAVYKAYEYRVAYDGNYDSIPSEYFDGSIGAKSEVRQLIDDANGNRFWRAINIGYKEDFSSNDKIYTAQYKQSVTLDDDSRFPTFEIIGWNTKADGTGEFYELDAYRATNLTRNLFDRNCQLTLYAVYKKIQHQSLRYPAGYKKQYDIGDCFDPTDFQAGYGRGLFFYKGNLPNLVTFSPSLTTPLTEADTKVTMTFKDFYFSDGQRASIDIPISVGTTYSVVYEENHPAGTWSIPTSRISDSYEWATDFTNSTAEMNDAGTAFTTAISVKGNTRYMIQQTPETTPNWKRLKEWNTKADGTGTTYTIGQSITTSTTDFTGKRLTLYAVWEDVPITQFRVLYKNGTNKEIATIFSYDLTTYIDTVLNDIPAGYDAFRLISNDSTESDDVVKNAYNPATTDANEMTLAQVKTAYTNWINGGATTNPLYGGIYKPKHFYMVYTLNGLYNTVTDETTYDSNYINDVVERMKGVNIRGWYEIVPTGAYDFSIANLYDRNKTTDLITTNELKTIFSNWNTNKNVHKAYGASVGVLSSISVKAGTGLKQAYTVNETLNVDNLVIVPTYDDGSIGSDIPYNATDFTITPAVGTAMALTNNTITVKYGGKQCTYPITVTEKAIDSIAIKDGIIDLGALKTGYIEGQTIDPTNLAITLTYDDLSTADIAYAGNEGLFSFSLGGNSIDISSYELNTSDAGNLIITYANKSCFYAITVAEKQVTQIDVKQNTPTKTTYYDGDALDVTGLILNVTYDNGKTEEVPYQGNEGSFTFNPANGNALSTTNTTVVVQYGGKEASFNITVTPVVITAISVKQNTPTTTTFVEGQNLDVTGLVIVATKNNGTTEDISYAGNETAFSFNPAAGSSLALGTNQVAVTYTNGTDTFNATYPLTVNQKQVTAITLSPAPTDTTYYSGETLDVTGLAVLVSFDNGTTETVSYVGNENKFSFNPLLTTPLATTHSGNVTVTYGGKSATYNITVTEPDPTTDRILESISVKTTPNKMTYNQGEALDPAGLVITANYSMAPLTEDISYTGNEARFIFTPTLGDGLTNGYIAFMYNGKQASFDVTINTPSSNPSGSSGSSSGSHEDVKPPVGAYQNDYIYHVPVTHTNNYSGFYNVVDRTYYRDNSGNNIIGWLGGPDAKWYLFEHREVSDKGKMITGFRKETYGTYYFYEDGKMATGLTDVLNKTYYFEDTKDIREGIMTIGWKNINGNWYYFDINGIMLKNTTTPDSYRVDANGKWVEN